MLERIVERAGQVQTMTVKARLQLEASNHAIEGLVDRFPASVEDGIETHHGEMRTGDSDNSVHRMENAVELHVMMNFTEFEDFSSAEEEVDVAVMMNSMRARSYELVSIAAAHSAAAQDGAEKDLLRPAFAKLHNIES